MQQQNAKGCILKVDLEYLEELMKMHNNYPLAPDEIEIEREMLPNYQIKFADFYNIDKNEVKKNLLGSLYLLQVHIVFLVFDEKMKVLLSKI